MSEDDFTRRTLLANERTYLAWWRTGLTTLTVALAAARIVPELSGAGHRWPYTVLGAAYAVLGLACVGYGEVRRAAIDRALDDGRDVTPAATPAFTAAGIVLGLGLLAVILAEP